MVEFKDGTFWTIERPLLWDSEFLKKTLASAIFIQ